MIISTRHLTLREFEESDFRALNTYQSDPRYLRFYPREWAERTTEEARAFLQRQIDAQHEQPRITFQLAITLRSDGKLIGNAGVRLPRPGATGGDIGCELDPEYWGQGYATEATRAMMAFGFEQLGLHRLHADTIAGNSAARRTLEKLGMTREGVLRQTTLLAGGWADTLVYGMLEDEWRARAAHP
jgi:RimJ/RimL family protein N-acetyltransferase